VKDEPGLRGRALAIGSTWKGSIKFPNLNEAVPYSLTIIARADGLYQATHAACGQTTRLHKFVVTYEGVSVKVRFNDDETSCSGFLCGLSYGDTPTMFGHVVQGGKREDGRGASQAFQLVRDGPPLTPLPLPFLFIQSSRHPHVMWRLQQTPEIGRGVICDACNKTPPWRGIDFTKANYQCRECDFDLCDMCAAKWLLLEHENMRKLLTNSQGLTCRPGEGECGHLLYCGREFCSPMSCLCGRCDGRCGPSSGCQCPDCRDHHFVVEKYGGISMQDREQLTQRFFGARPPPPRVAVLGVAPGSGGASPAGSEGRGRGVESRGKGGEAKEEEEDESKAKDAEPMSPKSPKPVGPQEPQPVKREWFSAGYPTELFVEPDMLERLGLMCPICLDVVRDMAESPCGHLACRACWIDSLAKNPTCPLDHQAVTVEQLGSSTHMTRMVLNLKVYCVNSEQGQGDCNWTGSVRDLEPHLLKDCPAELEACHLCGKQYPRKERKKHSTEECEHRSLSCDLCGSAFRADQLEKHKTEECLERQVECPNKGCTAPLVARALADHLGGSGDAACEYVPVQCPLRCEATLTRRDLQTHLSDPAQMVGHLQSLSTRLIALENQETDGTKQLFLRGTGWRQRERPGYEATIMLGDQCLMSSKKRGLHVVALLRSDLSVAFRGSFDTYAVEAESTQLIQALEAFTHEHLVLIASHDAFEQHFDKRCKDAIGYCGANTRRLENVTATIRHPYAFVGIGGLGPSRAIELIYSAKECAPFADLHVTLRRNPTVDHMWTPVPTAL
jgi:hypothetical protein